MTTELKSRILKIGGHSLTLYTSPPNSDPVLFINPDRWLDLKELTMADLVTVPDEDHMTWLFVNEQDSWNLAMALSDPNHVQE